MDDMEQETVTTVTGKNMDDIQLISINIYTFN